MKTKTKKVKLIDFPPTLKVGDIIEVMIIKKPKGGPKPKRMTIADLALEMREGFKQVNSRIDNLETKVDAINDRIDNLVAKNNLKE